MVDFEYQLNRIAETLNKLDRNAEGIRVAVEGLIKSVTDHEDRVRELEDWRGKIGPYYSAILFFTGVFVTAIISQLF